MSGSVTTIARGDGSRIVEPRRLVVRNAGEWRALWALHAGPDAAGDARVIVMHHNPVKGELSKRHGLKNTKKVLGAFAELGVDVVLCGHDHQEAVHFIEHTRKGTVISTAGTVSNRSRGGRPSVFNLVRIDPRAVHIQVRPDPLAH